MRNLKHLCYFYIGCKIFIDTNEPGALEKIKKEYGIESDYSINVEMDLKKQYPFLKTGEEEQGPAKEIIAE